MTGQKESDNVGSETLFATLMIALSLLIFFAILSGEQSDSRSVNLDRVTALRDSLRGQ